MTRKMEVLLIEMGKIVGGTRLAEVGMEDHEFGFWYVDLNRQMEFQMEISIRKLEVKGYH